MQDRIVTVTSQRLMPTHTSVRQCVVFPVSSMTDS
jgi:hypothetical protein